jgi:hypothetical protein
MRIIETTGVRSILEDDSDGMPDLPDIGGQPEDDGPDYPGEWNVWVCYGSNPCSICLENMAAGPVKAGDSFPSGDTAPPAHDRCECGLEAADPDTWTPPIILPRKKSEKAVNIATGKTHGPEDEQQ